MRSRYTAFVQGNADYLLATWHASTRPTRLEPGAGVRWLGLKVLGSSLNAPGDEGTVEFIARYRVGGAPAQGLHETSRFVRENGRWYYVDGEINAEQ